jgi:hypothetical protein
MVIDFNDALNDIWTKLKNVRGVLEFDDANYNDFPSGTFDLTSGTASYKITEDENANEIITIHKVQVKDGSGVWHDIPRKRVSETDQQGLLDTSTDTASMPDYYYEVGTRVVFSPIPNRTLDEGVKIWYDRAPQGFSVGGTTFEVGIPSIYHSLLGEKAGLKYALIKGLKQAQNLFTLVEMGEKRLTDYEGHRRHDEHKRITVGNHSTK